MGKVVEHQALALLLRSSQPYHGDGNDIPHQAGDGTKRAKGIITRVSGRETREHRRHEIIKGIILENPPDLEDRTLQIGSVTECCVVKSQ